MHSVGNSSLKDTLSCSYSQLQATVLTSATVPCRRGQMSRPNYRQGGRHSQVQKLETRQYVFAHLPVTDEILEPANNPGGTTPTLLFGATRRGETGCRVSTDPTLLPAEMGQDGGTVPALFSAEVEQDGGAAPALLPGEVEQAARRAVLVERGERAARRRTRRGAEHAVVGRFEEVDVVLQHLGGVVTLVEPLLELSDPLPQSPLTLWRKTDKMQVVRRENEAAHTRTHKYWRYHIKQIGMIVITMKGDSCLHNYNFDMQHINKLN